MKIAIIHDAFVQKGGSERVLLSLVKLYPTADIFVPLLTSDNRAELCAHTSGNVATSVLNHLPFAHTSSAFMKPLVFWYWEWLDLRDYDLVISSSHSFSSKAVLTRPDTLHLSYIHTPPRYLYTEYNETRLLHNVWLRVLATPLLSWLRGKDYLAAQRPDVLIANSHTVRHRIAKYYRRESILIHPPVCVKKVRVAKSAGRYASTKKRNAPFLCVSRLVKQKGLVHAVQACTARALPLVVIGEGPQLEVLRRVAGPTVSFLGRVSDAELARWYQTSRALLYCSIEEDFGLVPVEAMSHGLPVIGYRSGGVEETVVDGKTGVLFDELSSEGVLRAIARFEKKRFSSQTIVQYASRFHEAHFHAKMRRIIQLEYKKRRKSS